MDFRSAFDVVFGEDILFAADFFGVTLRTIYRWRDGTVQAPFMAEKLLFLHARGYLPEYAPFKDWKITGTVIKTPFGQADAFELEQYPAYRARYLSAQNRVEEAAREYKALVREVDDLVVRLSEIKRLRARILDFY